MFIVINCIVAVLVIILLVMIVVLWSKNRKDSGTRNIINEFYDSVEAGFIAFGYDHHITMANPFAERMVNKDINSYKIEDLFEFEGNIREEINNLSKDDVCRFECKGRDKRTYALRISGISDDHGNLSCYVCLFRDISEEIRLVGRLEQANNAKTSFLTSMSHEIRTPINTVIGFNEMISRESHSPSILEYTSNIDRAGHHLLTIINDLLDMEQITSGKIIINPEPYDLTEVLRDVYMIHSMKAQEKGLDFKLLSAPEIPRFLYGDKERLRQILINLVTNAIKYTRKGNVTLEADYWNKDEDHIDLIIRVSDTGIGIKEEDRARLFDEFERFDLDLNQYTEGAGLGLALTRSLVELMGGNISVESEYGKGSCFTASLPQKVSNFGSLGLNIDYVTKGRSGYSASFSAPSARILVVDDNEMNIKVAEGLIRPLKIKTEHATGGHEMLELIGKEHFDLILLDHLMPRMDGITALKRMKADTTHPNQDTPVIVMTANAIRGMREKFLAEGFTDYIAKPVEPHALEEMLRDYLPPELIEGPDGGPATEPEPSEWVATEKPDNNDNSDGAYELPEIKGIDLDAALKHSTSKDMVLELMKTFCRSSVTDLGELEEDYYRGVIDNDKEAIEMYQIKVHAMKNSAALIGATDLSATAKELEFASADGNIDYIREHHEGFVKAYEDISYALSNTLLKKDMEALGTVDPDAFMTNIELASQAMETFDTVALNNIMIKLTDDKIPSEEMKGYVAEMREAVKDFDRDRFFAAIDKIWSITE